MFITFFLPKFVLSNSANTSKMSLLKCIILQLTMHSSCIKWLVNMITFDRKFKRCDFRFSVTIWTLTNTSKAMIPVIHREVLERRTLRFPASSGVPHAHLSPFSSPYCFLPSVLFLFPALDHYLCEGQLRGPGQNSPSCSPLTHLRTNTHRKARPRSRSLW